MLLTIYHLSRQAAFIAGENAMDFIFLALGALLFSRVGLARGSTPETI